MYRYACPRVTNYKLPFLKTKSLLQWAFLSVVCTFSRQPEDPKVLLEPSRRVAPHPQSRAQRRRGEAPGYSPWSSRRRILVERKGRCPELHSRVPTLAIALPRQQTRSEYPKKGDNHTPSPHPSFPAAFLNITVPFIEGYQGYPSYRFEPSGTCAKRWPCDHVRFP